VGNTVTSNTDVLNVEIWELIRGITDMMFTTIPLVSLIRPDTLCVSCNKCIRTSIVGDQRPNLYEYKEFDVHEFYDYKCNSCISDRDYNMSNRYNMTHKIKEFMK